MAGTLRVGVSLTVDDTLKLLSLSRSVNSLSVAMAGDTLTHARQAIGTAKENLTLHGDHATTGLCFIRNLDATNYVDIGLDADTPFMQLKAGEVCLFRLAGGTTISAKANTAPVDVEYIVLED